MVADTPMDFVWTCTATAGTTPGKLTFEAGVASDKSQTNPVGMVYANAIANTVLVSPPLTFQVVVDDDDDLPYGLAAITNTAQAQSDGTAPTFATVNDLLQIPPPVAENDSSSGNTPGDPVTLNILTNDALEAAPRRHPRRCHRGAGSNQLPGGQLNPDGSVSVPGQGKWDYNAANGELTFTPCADGDAGCPTGGFTGDPSPIDYTLTETATGLSDTATVTVDYLEPGNITGTTWLDVDGDGVQDIGEPGIGGVTVYLLDGAGNPVPGGGSPVRR